MAEAMPLFRLQDGHAPYKGIWSFDLIVEGVVHATHSTFGRDSGPGCVIEHHQFDERQAARFASHLIIHGWGVLDLHQQGESLIYPPAPRP